MDPEDDFVWFVFLVLSMLLVFGPIVCNAKCEGRRPAIPAEAG